MVRGALDYEAAREHRLAVRATDAVSGAFADVSVLVRVLDVNDCAPRFERDEYRAAVREAAPLGAPLLAVRAADDDSGTHYLPLPKEMETLINMKLYIYINIFIKRVARRVPQTPTAT